MDTSAILPQQLTALDVFLRLLCAMAVGTVIGTEREVSNRPAGMRTHILVSLGAAAVMITSQMIFAQYRVFGALPDPARLPAQVITGVGFLGAGTIMREGFTVRGLTTAASLWAVACMGVAAGGGYYSVALVGTVFIFVTLTFFEFLQHRLISTDNALLYYCLDAQDVTRGLELVNVHARRQGASLRDMKVSRQENGVYQILFQADISGLHSPERRRHFLEGLTEEPEITTIHVFRKEVFEQTN